MFAVSTCWKSSLAESADDILTPILDLGVAVIELEYRITEKIFKEMLPKLKRCEPETVSVHNFFPLPSGLTRDQASGDVFLLASPEKEEREQALKNTLHTMEQAHEVGARAVVLHMGKTSMDDDFIRLIQEHENGMVGDNSIRQRVNILVEERKKEGLKHIDAALFSLDRLWRPAEKLGLKLGIENRYHLREIPNPHELAIFLDRFEGSNIGYWHDVGHAAVQELVYGIEHEQMLSRFSPHIIGVHLHDADGARDHQSPGKGKVNFKMVKKFIRPDTIRVIELAPGESEEDFRKGIEFLAGIFG